jgi:hypothetical protein
MPMVWQKSATVIRCIMSICWPFIALASIIIQNDVYHRSVVRKRYVHALFRLVFTAWIQGVSCSENQVFNFACSFLFSLISFSRPINDLDS